ncbi:MAG TPA: phosphoadenylyl-sulfate reductase [Acidimicrobiales bacterium]|nr:phosphoadenylyl-sulfate reductase [Acidimicrobiales bacterium]
MTIQAPLELDELGRQMEIWTAERVVEWTIETFGSRIAIAASMADTVLVHMATKIDPDVEVVFLDTGFHFSETLVTLRRAQSRYRLNLRVERAAPNAPDLFEVGTDGCCAARKVALLDRALIDKDAWMTGVRRSDASTRSAAPIVSRDNRGLVKVCPLATWTDDVVERYVIEHDVIVNPLQDEGYPSIGCWPCTEPVLDGEAPRAGRWRGSGKTECGLHFS